MRASTPNTAATEWPTVAMLVLCYGLWGLGTTWLAGQSLILAWGVVVCATALHASLCHEALHGHPFRNDHLNAALVFPALSMTVPYLRFRDTHLAHHRDELLTDPYDDPESNFWDPQVWARLPGWQQRILNFNNTLLGRLVIGPLIGHIAFVHQDIRQIRRGDRRVAWAWLLHLPAVLVPLVWMLSVAQMPLWLWALAVYAAHAVLKIRTFLEHRAHQLARGRTVIVEDRGLLAWLFLNNNLHVVHHMHPRVPWAALPKLYRQKRAHYLRRNEGFLYRSYAQVFREHFLRAKDPVPHPLWSKDDR